MILDHFELWARSASATDRADGVKILARAYLYSDLGRVRQDALRVLTGFLDDPSPLVRRTLAEALAGAGHAPHHLVTALADDQSEIASIVLRRSCVLTDAELVSCAACADEAAQVAIASRAPLGEAVAAALADRAAPAALVALAANRAASLSLASCRRLVERCGDRAELREALLTRPDLPASLRVDLVAATTRALACFVAERNWMSDDRMRRVAAETRDKAAVIISNGQAGAQTDLVTHLRNNAQITVGLALRAILSGRVGLFTAMLADLSGMEPGRVEGLSERCEGAGFTALYRKAGLPDALLPAFRCALHSARDVSGTGAARLDRGAVARMLAECTEINRGDLDALLVMLRRFETEAARDDARAMAYPARRAAQVASHAEPLVLHDADLRGTALADGFPRRIGRGSVEVVAPAQRKVTYEIDLAAIESVLLGDTAAVEVAQPVHPRKLEAVQTSAPPPRRQSAYVVDLAAIEDSLLLAA